MTNTIQFNEENSSSTNNDIKLMIATPAYSGKVDIPYAISYGNTYHLLNSYGIKVEPLLTASGSLLVAERNRILEHFWNSDCTHILMIDADLGWPAEAVVAMLQTGKEFVAGVYPARGEKDTFLFRPQTEKDGRLITHGHLIKMNYIPAGFVMITKSCLEKMRNTFPELYYEPKNKYVGNPTPGYCLFDTQVWEGEFWGEDYVFCRRAREAGVEIWVDPLIQFDHAGTLGMLIDILTTDPTGKNHVKPELVKKQPIQDRTW